MIGVAGDALGSRRAWPSPLTRSGPVKFHWDTRRGIHDVCKVPEGAAKVPREIGSVRELFIRTVWQGAVTRRIKKIGACRCRI